MSDLHDSDILIWSERQGELLRRRAAGELVNDAELDWPNIAEEIESVGSSQLAAVRSLLTRALAHTLKCEAWPASREVAHWRAEAVRFRQEALDVYSPSMRQRLDIERLYDRAVRQLPDTIDGPPPSPVPTTCPTTLDALLAVDAP
jgi:hypothetical protein